MGTLNAKLTNELNACGRAFGRAPGPHTRTRGGFCFSGNFSVLLFVR